MLLFFKKITLYMNSTRNTFAKILRKFVIFCENKDGNGSGSCSFLQ
jgi:hypothetical protein